MTKRVGPPALQNLGHRNCLMAKAECTADKSRAHVNICQYLVTAPKLTLALRGNLPSATAKLTRTLIRQTLLKASTSSMTASGSEATVEREMLK